MVSIIHYDTHIKTLCNLNAAWDRLAFFVVEKRKHVRFSQQILLILLEYLIG